MNRHPLFGLAWILMFCSVFAQNPENVVIVVMDGTRYSESYGDSTHQYIPHLWTDLRPLGTLYTNFYNDGVTNTMCGHASILSGTWQTIPDDGSVRPHMPTLFEYSRKERGTSASDNYVVLGKDKIAVVSHSDHPDYGSAYGASVKISTAPYDDATTLENFREVALASHPHLVIMNMAAIDGAAHAGDWSGYVSSIRRADSLVAELWSFIQSDSVYHDRTALFVTNDHGRHLDGIKDGFVGHGDGCGGCRHISLLVIGPGIRAGVVDSVRVEQIDIAPTVGAMLGFDTPLAVGSNLTSGTVRVFARWDMISLPIHPADNRVEVLFPTSTSHAFEYGSTGYVRSESLYVGRGYWMRFPRDTALRLQGTPVEQETIEVHSGWNMIGSISSPILTSSIGSIPSNMGTSQFFGYDDNYYVCDTLQPGRAYWVRTSEDGKFILSRPELASPARAICIVPTSEYPPSPPPAAPESPRIPVLYALEQNYPNPFNPSTTIHYQLPVRSRVTLRVYNTLGQVVQVLADGVEGAGDRRAGWNGDGLPSGVYFCRLDATSVADPSTTFTGVKKMVLIR